MSALRQPAPLLDRARRILQPTIFLPGLPSADPVELANWDELEARLREMAAGRALTFMPGRMAYPGFDDLFGITVRAGGDYVCALADRWHDERDMTIALAELRRLV
jgi:hypothetical protein